MSSVVELRQSEADRYENVHDWLKQELNLPEWYGHNLDALWDCVTGYLPRPLNIRWIADSEHENRYSAIVEVFQDAADQYDDISFEYVTSRQEG
ncbi:barstar family protein [Paenibacillus sp. D2_2]|uniref:barstar family protein n=1 Tax=Paenibacillus sp. D2_2 TaxID=3073092 RepID=UPI0028150EEF|nr:barstar family protein [Paenibacillus sp. D2_2]WMT41382.1 barstar family protein [Paenibacillus sp. D2_2]